MVESLIIPSRIKLVRELIHLGADDEYDIISARFECLGNEVWLRASALLRMKVKGRNDELDTLVRLSPAFKYTSLRLTDLFDRLAQLEWMREGMTKEPDMAEFAQHGITGVKSMWRPFMSLGIKDFHSDVASLMDSIAALVMQVQGEIPTLKQSPGFSWVEKKGHSRKYVPENILAIIDKTDSWWPTIKEVRDVLNHREHLKLVFGTPTDGILFQVYEGPQEPKILDSHLMHPNSHNVVDFGLYSAWVLSEMFVFLEDVGEQIADILKFGSMTPSMRMGNFKSIAASLEKLVAVAI
ncbi:MAG: hypothetical protein FJ316_02570 [SAR202 cluster bacterium]|nr:hypothetical protein [SAR202 cluster bacterium]